VTPAGLAFPQAVMHALSLAVQLPRQSNSVRHDALCPQAADCEQHVLVMHVFKQASVALNPPHAGPPSEGPKPQAAPQGPVRQEPTALSASVPVGCAVAQAFSHAVSPPAQLPTQSSRATHSALPAHVAPTEQQFDVKQLWHASVSNANPHAPASAPAAPPHSVVQLFETHPVSEL
jgi:hypothetical protein